MRNQFVNTIENILNKDQRLVLFLGDIGVFGFRKAFKAHPNKVYNIGICEQAMTSMAAGLAKEGLIPVLHSIAPFVVERCYEQLKIDFIYQGLGGNIVSVGASYDYGGLGYTHHCPADVTILKALPGMQIVLPGTPEEFDQLFRSSYSNSNMTYFRLSEQTNLNPTNVEFGKIKVIKTGELATVLAIGPTLSRTIEATDDLDVTILYCTTIAPFDAQTLSVNISNDKVLLVEPYNSGLLCADIHNAQQMNPVKIRMIGVPNTIINHYGNYNDFDQTL